MSAHAERIDLPGHLFAEYKGDVCCWCLDASPDSREHRFKRSDLAQQFGRGPYVGRDETVVGTNDGRLVPVQGPRSSELKFRPSLCRACNGARSQPFDRAWATLTTYISANEAAILNAKAIDFGAIFGDGWQAEALNVGKYIVKHALCRIAHWRVLSPEPIRAFLDGAPYPDCLALDPEIRLDILAATRALRGANIPEGSLWNGPPSAVLGSDGEPAGIQAFLGYGWLRWYWAVGEDLGGYARPFETRILPLSEGYSIPPEEVRLGS